MNSPKFNAIVISLLISVGSVALAQDITLDGIALSDWGVWGELERCPIGSYVFGMRLKVHKDQGVFEDDTALNGIQLLCFSASSQVKRGGQGLDQLDVISSTMGHKGDIGTILDCPDPYYVIGFQLRSEKPDLIGPLGDDTAGNNLRLVCNDANNTVLEGYGTQWGDWTQELRCPRGLRICAIQTKVEGPNGDDDTTLNNVNMGCCI